MAGDKSENSEKTGRTLVAYFSASGVTARVAERLAHAAGADLFEIVPVQPYTAADLDWTNKQSRSSLEMADASSRPEIAGVPEGLAAYDTVLLGFPIWWYTAPTIVKTFLEAGDFAGKRVALFATSGGSGMGRTQADLAPSAPDAVWSGEKCFSACVSEQELAAWVAELGL